MRVIIDFVGDIYYTKREFVEEAKKFGFSRKLNINVKKGDYILFCKYDKEKDKSYGFALGRIENILIPSKLTKKLEELGIIKVVENISSLPIIRGCGYMEQNLVAYKSMIEDCENIFDILEYLKKNYLSLYKEFRRKIFYSGYLIKDDLNIELNLKFFRGNKYIDIDIDIQEKENKSNFSNVIFSYDMEKYRKYSINTLIVKKVKQRMRGLSDMYIINKIVPCLIKYIKEGKKKSLIQQLSAWKFKWSEIKRFLDFVNKHYK